MLTELCRKNFYTNEKRINMIFYGNVPRTKYTIVSDDFRYIIP